MIEAWVDEASLAAWAAEDATLSGDDDAWLEEPLPSLSDRELLDSAANTCRSLRMFESQQLLIAADWADRNPGIERISVPDLRAGKERGSQLGGVGTPIVAEFAPAELAAALGTTTGAGQRLVADALDLRHRLPRLWSRVVEAEVPAWQARKIAQATRPLTCVQARGVDAEVADLVGGFPWSRLERIVDGHIIAADPERAARLADQAARSRFVTVDGSNRHGTRMMVAQMDAADAAWLDGVVDRIAELLPSRRNVVANKDERRAMALGLLARPVEVLQLLTEGTTTTGETTATGATTAAEEATSTSEKNATTQDTPGTTSGAGHVPEDPPSPAEDAWPDPDPLMSDPIMSDPPGQGIFRSAAPTAGRLSAEEILAAVRRVDAAAWRPSIMLYAHLAVEALGTGEGAARVEQLGPQTLSTIRDWLSRADVIVRPVINLPQGTMPSDAYEVPPLMREHLCLTHPVAMSPWSTGSSRTAQMDHSQPYDHARPTTKRQTRLGNLAPLATFAHRLVTHGHWQRRQPQPGTMLFRAPHGRVLVVDHLGTRDLGTGRFADLVWNACRRVASDGATKEGVTTIDAAA